MIQLAKVFQNGRIPKEFRVDTEIIKPKKENRWEKLFMLLDEVDTSDFMKERVQPPLDDKELF